MKNIDSFAIDKDLKEFFASKKKAGYNKSALLSNILKESVEYKEYVRKNLKF